MRDFFLFSRRSMGVLKDTYVIVGQIIGEQYNHIGSIAIMRWFYV